MSEDLELFPQAPATTRLEFHLGDCIAGLANLPAESIDLVVTSPPYNLGIKYSRYDDQRTPQEYLDWSLQWACAVKRVLKDDGALFLNVAGSPKQPYMPHELILSLRGIFILQNTLHWIKSISVRTPDDRHLSVGHFKPINSKRYLTDCHEYLFQLTKNGDNTLDRLAVGVPYTHKSNIARWGHTDGKDKRCRGNNWFVPYKTIMSRKGERPHPATFPIELAENCIKLHGTHPGQTTMLDPFLGIGHAAEAAKKQGVARFIGFEIDEQYLSVACKRLGTTAIQPETRGQ
jgi:site-specific DNA-methyltransferase (adenine-specific)